MPPKDIVFVLDVDGTVTDGRMYYTRDGKIAKAFGADDWCALKTLAPLVKIHFITGDKRGFQITQKRIEDDCNYLLDLVPTDPHQRWNFIRSLYQSEFIVFMGDGLTDWLPLRMADYGITTSDALPETQYYADYVTPQKGGRRAVAAACLHIDRIFKLNCFPHCPPELAQRESLPLLNKMKDAW